MSGDIHRTLDSGPHDAIIGRLVGLRPRGMVGFQTCFGPADPNGAALLAGIVRSGLVTGVLGG